MSDLENEVVEEDVVESDVIEMSDEDFMKMDEPVPVVEPEIQEGEEEVVVEEEVAEVEEEVGEDEVAAEAAPADDEQESSDDTTEEEVEDKEIQEKKEDKPTDTIDYKAEYEKLIAPFKANGTQMQVKSTDDILTLMQMGANYHKKMLGLKPSMKIMKLLEKNNLLDPDKINYLIDLHSKNPDAISKLVKDSGIDPLDMDVSEESKYVPKTRTVSDTELELDSVLEDIQNTPTYSKTLTVITEQWDDASRNTIATNPHIISVINEHVSNGTYDKVYSAVEYERSLGKLKGLSDLDAYKHMGNYMQSQGLLTDQPVTKQASTPVVSTPAKAKETDIARKERKKAVSPTRNSSVSTPVEFNPLSISDEEFAKLSTKNFKI